MKQTRVGGVDCNVTISSLERPINEINHNHDRKGKLPEHQK